MNVLKKNRFFITIALEVCFRLRLKECSGKPRWLQNKLYTSVFVYADDVNILGETLYNTKEKTKALLIVSRFDK